MAGTAFWLLTVWDCGGCGHGSPQIGIVRADQERARGPHCSHRFSTNAVAQKVGQWSRSQDTSPVNAGGFTSGHRQGTIHDHGIDARCVLVRVREGGVIGHGSGIQDCKVGGQSGPDPTTILKAEARRNLATHPVHRVFQGEYPKISHVPAKNPRRRTIVPWVRAPDTGGSTDGQGRTI